MYIVLVLLLGGTLGVFALLIVSGQVTPTHAVLCSQIVCTHGATAAIRIQLRLDPTLFDLLQAEGSWASMIAHLHAG